MKTKHFILAITLFAILLSGSLFAAPSPNVDWDAFSKNLTKAISSGNEGLQQSAMCMIIRYGDNLTIPRETVFEIVRTFRTEKEKNVRLLALVTLHKIEDPWAMDFLKRHRRFEKEERVKQLCCCCVSTYYAKQDSIKMEKTRGILADATEDIVNQYYASAANQLNIEQYGL
jgi:hypothetical protein